MFNKYTVSTVTRCSDFLLTSLLACHEVYDLPLYEITVLLVFFKKLLTILHRQVSLCYSGMVAFSIRHCHFCHDPMAHLSSE